MEKQFIALCYKGDLEGAKRLLEIYPEIDISYDEECAFDDACINGYLEIAKWLLELKPNINISICSEQTFRYACINNHLELAKWLLSVKPDINISADNDGAFRWACRYKYLEVAKWLQSLKPYLYVIEYSKNGKYIPYHYGFYRSAESVANKTVISVSKLKKKFPDYSVIMTGHSYGAATVQLLGMELERFGIDVEIYNYGQPRVGDANYAGFVNTVIDEYWRFTHDKDIVPHLPPMAGLGYLHSCREVFEDVNGNLQVCSETDCEDALCSGQYSVSQTNRDDHSYYLGHYLDCESSTQMGP